MASDYSLSDAFKAIEDDLIASMMRNIDHHRAEEDDQGINWTMWQSEQLKSLEEYKQSLEGYKEKFTDINSQIDKLIRTANKTGSMEQEIEILEAIKQGFSATKVSSGLSAKFFSLNERKLEALITATVSDMEKAEYAILRKSEDAYRKVIYNAQVYANTGAGTYEKAVDMATKNMLSAGLTCVQYKNGAVHTLADYADMAIRTASKRAYLQGEGAMRQEWGIHTVIVNKRINPCPHCLPFCGKVFIDDVWSGGTKKDGDYPLLSTAIAAGLYHPRCKDAHSTYFPGISSEPDKTYSKKELKTIEKNEARETRQQYAQRQADKYGRLSKYSLDEENQQKYAAASERYEEAASSLDTGTSTTQGTLEELFDGSLETMERQLEDVSEELEDALETVENDLNSDKKHLQTSSKNDTINFDGATDSFDRKARLYSRDEDLQATNPNWSSKKYEWTHNCQRCVPTYEMRRRGYNVTAKPLPAGSETVGDYLQSNPDAVWSGAKRVICTDGDGQHQIETKMKEWGEGSRAVVGVRWTSGGGHVFCAEVKNGKVIYVDPQTGSLDCSGCFRDVMPGTAYVFRVDNLSPTELIKDCCGNIGEML